jgi:proline-rich protein PRCC
MLLGNYASDSEGSDDESGSAPIPSGAPPPTAAAAVGKPKRKGPVKITLDLPKSTPESKVQGDRGGLSPSGEDEDGERDGKRAKTGLKGGKGS